MMNMGSGFFSLHSKKLSLKLGMAIHGTSVCFLSQSEKSSECQSCRAVGSKERYSLFFQLP
jgi:hypothetical protein